MGGKTWPSYAFSSSTRASWPPRLLKPMPQLKRRKPPRSQSTSSVSKPDGLRVSPMPKRPLRSTKGVGRGGVGASPGPGRYHALPYRVEAVTQRQKRTQRGRPPQTAQPQDRIRYRLRGEAQAHVPSTDTQGWTVLATTVGAESCTDTEILQAYQEQHITVEPGFRWIKNPAAISPVWLEKPERIAALAMLTVVGLLVYAVIQRQVRRYLHDHAQHVPGNKGPTATPTAAVVFALFAPVMLVQFVVENTTSLQGYGVQEHHRIVSDHRGSNSQVIDFESVKIYPVFTVKITNPGKSNI